ncbi:MAG: recombination mediator RecR [Kiritimatiellia bacterium]|nr:recombination mediator RecR [Kiritimatiellia bacterium]
MIEPLDKLAAVLSRLPGIGRRSGERIAVRLARDPSQALSRDLIAALTELQDRVRICSRCGGLTDAQKDPCRFCSDPRRDSHLLCIVGQPGDVDQMESSGAFQGRYHILRSKISPMRSEGLADLHLELLSQRLEQEPIREIILALDTDMESDATAAYLKEWLAPRNLKVSRLAFGIPAGSGVAYSDPLTLARALDGRREV